MNLDEDLARAIRQRDVESILRIMFMPEQPTVRPGFCRESELWDFKKDCPRLGKGQENPWAEMAKDVLAFHNHRGGLLVFGIRDDNFLFSGASTRLDSKLINDQVRRYLGDRIWIDFNRSFIQGDQRYLGIAVVPPRGPRIERFTADAPLANGSRLFRAGDSAIRDGDSTRLLKKPEADKFARELAIPTLGKLYAVDESWFRIPNPDYANFVHRGPLCDEVERALHDPRSSVTSLIGVGGVGKTALATWATLRAYDEGAFSFIVSITAKDRELTSRGIQALEPSLTSFETLLNAALDVLGFPELKSTQLDAKERELRHILEDSKGLLYVDNLETVDDVRIIRFLDSLPVGTRAIVTSRRTRVRVSAYPIDVGPLTDAESLNFIASLADQPGFGAVRQLASADRLNIARNCGGVALAIRWVLSSSHSSAEAIALAESLTGLNRNAEELLEFCFRRIFEAMPGAEKNILYVLSLFQRPVPTEALLVGARLPDYKVLDITEGLVSDALVQRLFDPDRNEYCYTMLPLARAFVYGQVSRQSQLERDIRKTLSDWFDAKDVENPEERVIIREIRQGTKASESPLLDLAAAAEKRGDRSGAEQLYRQALERNPRSWRACRALAESQRHQLGNYAEAIKFYERAATNAPRTGADRALIFREWGMLLRDSGDRDSTDQAIEKFETARREDPTDVLTTHALAHMLSRKGNYRRVIELLEPLSKHPNMTTRRKTLPLLLDGYEHTGEIVKAADIRPEAERLAATEEKFRQ